jgi:hypothetical protein
MLETQNLAISFIVFVFVLNFHLFLAISNQIIYMQKRSYKTSVPQFGGWENKPKGVPTDYSMVFNQARENKKNHKTDVLEVRRLSVGNDQRVASNTTNHRHGHGHGRGRGSTHGSGHNHPNGIQDPPVMVRHTILVI